MLEGVGGVGDVGDCGRVGVLEDVGGPYVYGKTECGGAEVRDNVSELCFFNMCHISPKINANIFH